MRGAFSHACARIAQRAPAHDGGRVARARGVGVAHQQLVADAKLDDDVGAGVARRQGIDHGVRDNVDVRDDDDDDDDGEATRA